MGWNHQPVLNLNEFLTLGHSEQLSLCHYAVPKQRKLIVVIVPFTSSSSTASYGCILYNHSFHVTLRSSKRKSHRKPKRKTLVFWWESQSNSGDCTYDLPQADCMAVFTTASWLPLIAAFGRKIRREMRGKDKASPYLHSRHHECCDGQSWKIIMISNCCSQFVVSHRINCRENIVYIIAVINGH